MIWASLKGGHGSKTYFAFHYVQKSFGNYYAFPYFGKLISRHGRQEKVFGFFFCSCVEPGRSIRYRLFFTLKSRFFNHLLIVPILTLLIETNWSIYLWLMWLESHGLWDCCVGASKIVQILNGKQWIPISFAILRDNLHLIVNRREIIINISLINNIVK